MFLYVFMSGLGLFLSWSRTKDLRCVNRILKLVVNFWLVIAIFIPLGVWYKPENFLMDLSSIVQNITG